MRRIALLMGLLGSVVVGPVALSGPAQSTCTLHPQHARLVVTLAGYPNVLTRSGDDLVLNHSSCDGATVDNTDLIDVTSASTERFTALRIGMSHGMFSPGATIGAEIPIHVDLTQSFDWRLQVATGTGAQHIVIDDGNVDLDADEPTPQVDIVVSHLDTCGSECFGGIVLSSGAGPDHVIVRHTDPRSYTTVSTGPGDDVARVQQALVFGGHGNDRLQTHDSATLSGDQGNDSLIGGAGHDDLFGFDGKDRIFGRGGRDWVRGGEGRDILVAGRADDELFGEADGDRLWGGPGSDLIDGGDGFDRCQPNRGGNLRGTDCEHPLRAPPPAL